MLTTRLRKQIEWHFYNHEADLAVYQDKARDIIGGGLTANFGRIGSGTGSGNPTEDKVLRLAALDGERTWATVVRNTFNAFKFEPEYEVMMALYIDRRTYKDLCDNGMWERTLYRWRDKWLEHAYKWAKEFNLL